MDAFFRFFERFAQPFANESFGHPPAGGIHFILHFARQAKGPFLVMLALGGITAFIEASMFVFVGVIVDLMNGTEPFQFFETHGTMLLVIALFVAIGRALVAVATAVVEEQVVVPHFFTMVRWQSHRAVAAQDVAFFDDEMAGRISSKVWQSGQAAGDVMVSLLQIIWFIAIFALTTLVVVASLDWRMMIPVLIWLGSVAAIARWFVPQIRDRGRQTAESASVVTGRMVDGYSNIRTVKLFGASDAHDQFIREAWEDTLKVLRRFTRSISGMRILFQILSSSMLVIIAGLAIWLYTREVLSAGEVAIVLALSLRLNLLMGRLLGLLNGLFRNFGTVQNSAELISKKPKVTDRHGALSLNAAAGNIEFQDVSFAYGEANHVIENFNLSIPTGQKVGIVGKSGVGKSTLMNLLLRFHDINSGMISIDGTDVATVTQHSLRAQMGIVAQDSSLLHRSIRDNIGYGKPEASLDEIVTAAKQANADDFIQHLQDAKGRTAYNTFVGERGVKLSGGQRQRVALARVFLKDAPILLLDEATSALDSEVEAAIQEHLEELMRGKTVVAIAHRLSTIAHLDRLIVIDEGRIVEDGKHAELLALGGHYARLWNRQSGGFLETEAV